MVLRDEAATAAYNGDGACVRKRERSVLSSSGIVCYLRVFVRACVRVCLCRVSARPLPKTAT